METIKIGYADFWNGWEEENFIEPILKRNFNVIIDQKSPDILFHSVFNGLNESSKYKCKKILYTGENYRPSKFKTDYSISFDQQTKANYRLPLWQVYLMLKPELKDRLFNRVHHENFEYFCAFIVSNSSNSIRNNHFDRLSEYRKVESYGKTRTNNMMLQNLSKGRYWRDAKNEFFISHPHKFMLAYENTSYPWYCTEKLMDAFLSGSMPLYWGDPKISEDWNQDAFINIQKSGLDWLHIIKNMDMFDLLFNDVYNEPIFTDKQKENHLQNINEFENWLIQIIKE